jgi:hypothetical protein
MQDDVTFTSLEQQQTLYIPHVQEKEKKAFCEATYKNSALNKEMPVFASVPGGEVPLTTAASLGVDLGYDRDQADGLAQNDCVINDSVMGQPPQSVIGIAADGFPIATF